MQESKPSRRKLLKALVGTGGVAITAKNLPGSWTRPIVASVLLPAHAQTSCNETLTLVPILVARNCITTQSFYRITVDRTPEGCRIISSSSAANNTLDQSFITITFTQFSDNVTSETSLDASTTSQSTTASITYTGSLCSQSIAEPNNPSLGISFNITTTSGVHTVQLSLQITGTELRVFDIQLIS